ncbi:ribokinase [Paenibacillus filicis]|uniref:Ribokinase n=1 Tax=Paenibacillus filicis TaxID=669464 RepID=A0ABU9DGG6_9BACL
MKVIVIGSANMDMVMRTGRLPQVGETLAGGEFLLSPGGKGANQAVACARMGADTWLIAKVGADVFGEAMLRSLEGCGVRTDYVQAEPDVSTGVAAITVCGGNNQIVLAEGANGLITPDCVRGFREELLSAGAVLLQLETPLDAVYEAIRLVKSQVPIFLNPAPARPLDDEMLRGVDYFTPNEIECRLYTGIEIRTHEDALAALDVLRAKGIRYPLITLGEKGVVYYNGTENVYREGRKVQAVDTTAAGDTFSGTLAAMIVAGRSLDESVHLAQLAASISVTRQGAQPSIPALSEIM